MAIKSIIVVEKKGRIKPVYWTNMKECINELGLPYHTLSRLKSPISYLDYKIYRLPKNK